MLEHCELQYNQADVYAGNTFEISLISFFSDGTEEHSDGPILETISFSDAVCNFTGPAKFRERGSKIKVTVSHEAVDQPFLSVDLLMKGREDLKFRYNIPIQYNSNYEVAYYGKNGKKGRNGTNGWTHHVQREDPIIHPGQPSEIAKYNGRDGKKGESGPKLDVFISMTDDVLGNDLIKVQIQSKKYDTEVRYLTPDEGTITISSIGGYGGNGGTCSPVGEYYRIYGYYVPCAIHGGGGGEGGDGGEVDVFITDDAKPYYDQINIDNLGNKGGYGGSGMVTGSDGGHGVPGDITVHSWEQ